MNLHLFYFILLISLTACKNKPARNVDNNKHPIVAKAPGLDSASLINDLAYLSSGTLEGRETGSPGNKIARDYIVKRYDSLGLKAFNAGRLQEFALRQNRGVNIIAAVTGTTYPDRYFVLSAHYDHLGIKNGEVYHGADDNASGTACLLVLARYFRQHPPRHSFLFASFDAEEKGLAGSSYFVQHSPVGLNKILLNINMDMISRNDKNEIYVAGTRYYPSFKKYIDTVRSHTTVNVLPGHDEPEQGTDDWTSQSDHYPFHKAHIPFLYFGVEDHPDYHRPTDTFDKIDKGFYYGVCDMIRKVIEALDRKEERVTQLLPLRRFHKPALRLPHSSLHLRHSAY